MATAIISGRVDEAVKTKAAAYLRAAKVAPGDVIKTVWENIAATGQIPVPEAAERETEDEEQTAFGRLMRFREELPACPELATMTDEQMRDMIVERYL